MSDALVLANQSSSDGSNREDEAPIDEVHGTARSHTSGFQGTQTINHLARRELSFRFATLKAANQ